MKLFLVFLQTYGNLQVTAHSKEEIEKALIDKGWEGRYISIMGVFPRTPETIPYRKEYLGV